MLTLFLSAELNNVTNLQPVEPFEYKFKIQCTKCRETHDKIISINLNDKVEHNGQETNFLFHCKFCKKESKIDISKPKKFQGLQIADEESGNGNNKNINKCGLLDIDARGLDILEFDPSGGVFQCDSNISSNKFQEVELSDLEWYDYDDMGNDEVAITEVKFEITKF